MRLLSIAVGTNDGEIVRRDTDTLVMTLRDGFVNDPFSRLARGDSVPFHVGETSTVGGMMATVEALTTDGRPQRVRFRFDRPLDDPTFAWTAWDGAGFVPMIAPAVGERRPVRGIDYLASLTGT